MKNSLKKIVAIISLVGVAGWAGGVQAITADELQVQINALLAQLTALQSQLATLEGGTTPAVTGCSITSFDRSLKVGMSGDDVKCLQITLNASADTQVAASGVGSAGNETMYFGPLTMAAVIKFQEKYASEVLASYGLTNGTGFVGTTTKAKLNSMLTSGGTTPPSEEEEEEPVAGAGENKVSLAADTPAASTVAKGAQDVIFAKVNFCAASEANTVSKIILKRGGIAADADISAVKIYEGIKQVGSTQAINSTSHKATFSSLNWTIAANSCKVLTVKASIAIDATQGDTAKFEITAATDITSTVALDGVFPVSSTGKTIAGISTGEIQVSTTSPSGGTKIAGGVEQDVAGFKFTASSSEAVDVHSVTLTEVGSSVSTDVSNVKLFYGSTQVGSTVAALDAQGKVTFDLSSAPVSILAGGSKTLKVTVDIGSTIGVDDRTIAFEIGAKTDVTAYGSNSGGSVPIRGADNWGTDGTWPQKTAEVDIVLGSLTVSEASAYSPAAQDYAKGTDQNDIVAFKFTAGATEGVRITQLKLQETVAGLLDTDVNNLTLYDAETGVILTDTSGNLVSPASMIGGYATFGSYTSGLDASGLFDVVATQSKYILVKADVPTGASATDAVLGFKIANPSTDIKADGLSSQNDLSSSEITPSTAIPSTAINHDIIANGTLTVQPSTETPSSATYAVGRSDLTLAKFDFITTGESITISELNIYFSTNSAASTDTADAADAADVSNIRIYDGAALLKTDSVVSSGKAEFGLNLSIAKNITKTLTVVVDIPSGSDASNLTAWIAEPGDITAAGDASAQTITAAAASWGAVRGSLFTKGVPEVVVKAATTPISQTYVKNSSGMTFTTLYLTASTTEDIKITKIRLQADATTSASIVAGKEDAFLSENIMVDDPKNLIGNISLWDGTTQVGATKAQFTDGATYNDYVDFDNLDLRIDKGETKVIDVKAKVINSTSTSWYLYVGMSSSTSNITGSGLQSGTAASVVVNEGSGTLGQGIVLGASGSLTVQLDVNTPISAQVKTGTPLVALGKWKFTSTNEAIKISKLVLDVVHTNAATGTSYSGAALSTTSPDTLATSGASFLYSINDGATTTCTFSSTTATEWDDNQIIADEINTDCIDLIATVASGILTISASSTDTTGYSIEITPFSTAATDAADNFNLGLHYGGVETVGTYAGANQNLVAGKVGLYDDGGILVSSEVALGAPEAGRVIFNWNSGSELEIPYPGNKVLTVKADISAYTSALEGSTISFALASTSGNITTSYIVAKGASSDATLGDGDILDSDSATGTALASNVMYLYATKPTVSLNGASPSGSQIAGSNREVFRFDVQNPDTSQDIRINAVRFTIGTWAAASSSIFDRTFKLYKSTDLTNEIGVGVSMAAATATDSTGWVVVYPDPASQIGAGSTVTYLLKGDVSGMDENTSDQILEFSIADGDFYWDDGQVVNARDRVLNLPVVGDVLKY